MLTLTFLHKTSAFFRQSSSVGNFLIQSICHVMYVVDWNPHVQVKKSGNHITVCMIIMLGDGDDFNL